MTSAAWLLNEVKPLTTQVLLSPAPLEGPLEARLNSTIGKPMSETLSCTASDSVQESPQGKFADAANSVFPAPSFTYNVLPSSNMSSASSQQTSSVSGTNSKSPASAVLTQPQVSGLASLDSSTAVGQASGLSSATAFQSVSLPFLSPSNSTIIVSSSPNLGPSASQTPSPSSLLVSPGLSGTPRTPAPAGLAPSVPISHSSAAADYASSVVQRPTMPTASTLNPVFQQQTYPTYPPLPSVPALPQAHWMQPPHMSGMARPPFFPYPAFYSGPFPQAAHGIPPPFSLPDSQPPGVSPIGHASTTPTSSIVSGNQLAGAPGLQAQLPLGIDKKPNPHDDGTMDNSTTKEALDVWTAHKSDTGHVYYYNVVTGVSTYERPPGFKGEPDKVSVQPTPVSMENLAGTDWALITTNDGKKYYYNTKAKTSSWQIPSEVTEMRKKQEDHLKENATPVSNTDKGSGPINLSAPAVNTGGRDATPLRSSSASGPSSALDLIKKKLQEFGAPVTSSPAPVSSGMTASELNGSRASEAVAKGWQGENNKDKLQNPNGDGNVSDSSSDSEDEGNMPTKEECIVQFKEMLKERGVAPFSKWEKELPKIVFDPRFKAIPSHSARRALFEHYVKTRAEEERKEKRAAQKAAVEGFKHLLDEASKDIDYKTDYQTFKKKWGNDPRFEALDRKDREHLFNERVVSLKKAAQEKAEAERAAVATSFKSMLQDRGDISINSRWSKVKDSLRDDPRYKSVKHEDREILFNQYLSELRSAEEEAKHEVKAKREEEDKLKERERELRKRKEREEQEMEKVRVKVRRKEAVASFQALLVETIKDPQASWTESKLKLEKDPQRRATNPDLDPSEMEKLFRDHIRMLLERYTHDFKALLAEVITAEAAAEKTEDGKTVLDSWSTAKHVLKPDPRYKKMPRKEREALWRRHADDILRRKKVDHKEDKHTDSKVKSSTDSGIYLSASRSTRDRR